MKKDIHQLIQTTANASQIIALVIAGAWAVTLWIQQVWPLLDPNIDARASVTSVWSNGSNACLTDFTVSLENRGLGSVQVSAVPYRLYRIPIPVLDGGATFASFTGSATLVEPPGNLESLVGEIKPREFWHQAERFLISPQDPYHYVIEASVKDDEGLTLQAVAEVFSGCHKPKNG